MDVKGVKDFDPQSVRIPGTSLQGWRAIAVGALALYILLFIALNNRRLEVNFVFFKIRSNELLGLVVLAGLSFVSGYVLGTRRWRGQPPPAQPPRLEPPADAVEAAPPDSAAPAPEDTSARTRS